MDDKAYVRPGTSVGFRDVKKSGIFQPSDPQAARQLPKYDWAVKEVYVTPATHRVFTKEPRVVGEKQAYVMSEDDSFLFMRPKAQVGSSGTVWSSEDYVQYRMVETILIHGLDYVVRVHRARVDSGQNEAERTNASIGDALVTGETLQWDFHK